MITSKNMGIKFSLAAKIAFVLLGISSCATVGGNQSVEVGRFSYTMPIGADEVPPSIVKPREPPQSIKAEDESDITFGTQHTQTHSRQEVWGYRIQIHSAMQEDEAQQKAADAVAKLEDDVFVGFDSPYYKVRVGNCKTADEAEELLMKIKRAGYPDAWMVRSRIIQE